MNVQLTSRGRFAVSFGRVRFAAGAALAASALAAGQASAAFTVDQQQLLNDNGSGEAGGPQNAAFGQSFVPATSTLQWAEFMLRDVSQYYDGSGPISVSLSVLSGQIGSNGLAGAVLATSPTVLVSSTAGYVPTDFQFATPLTVTPGQTYVLAVNVLSDSTISWEQAHNDYANGQMLQHPYSASGSPNLDNQDYVFREGTGIVPEPAALATLALAGTGLLARRRRR